MGHVSLHTAGGASDTAAAWPHVILGTRAKAATTLLGAAIGAKIDGIRMREALATLAEWNKRITELETRADKLAPQTRQEAQSGDDGGDDDE